MSIIEKSVLSRNRFKSPNGNITTEDLLDLKPEVLNEMAKEVNRELSLESEEDFLKNRSVEASGLSEKLEVLKYVINLKLAERDRRANEKVRADERQRLLRILAERQEEDIKSLSTEDLKKRLEELGN